MDAISYVLSKNYTDETAIQFGGLKGASCQIKSIDKSDGVTTVTFLWKNDEGATRESQIVINDGAKGETGEQGIQGPKGDKGDTGAQGPQGDPGTPIYPWTAGTAYAVGDLAIYSNCFFLCIVANSDLTFDDTKWIGIGSSDGNYDIVTSVEDLPEGIFTEADRKIYYVIEEEKFYEWNGLAWIELPLDVGADTSDCMKKGIDYVTAGHSTSVETSASGRNVTEEGYNTISYGNYGHAEGSNTTVNGESGHAEGSYTYANGTAHAEGTNTYAGHNGTGAHAEGNDTTALGEAAHAEGMYNIAEGNRSHAEGYYTTAYESVSHAEGMSTSAAGYASHAEGNSTTALGTYSHAEGSETYAADYYSHAEGSSTTALSQSSHAEGFDSLAEGGSSHAEGSSSAIGDCSHSEGSGTIAHEFAGHAEGYNTESYDTSHAEGYQTTANGLGAHSGGNGTYANGTAQMAIGQYNRIDTNEEYAFIIGDGSSDVNRSNLFGIKWNGTVEVNDQPLGTYKAVSTVANQGLTSAEQSNARENIGAGTSNFSGSYNDLSNKPTIPAAANNGTLTVKQNGANKGTFTADQSENSIIELIDTTYENKSAASGGTDVSLVTTGEKYTWNNKSDFSGDYNDLSNKPTIPDVSSFMKKGVDYVTAGKAEGSTIGNYSTAEGSRTIAEGSMSHAEGYKTCANGNSSHAEGGYTTAEGEGGTFAIGNNAHTEGYYTYAVNENSHAEGFATYVSGKASHAEGRNTYASGEGAHAEGTYTCASGIGAHAEGYSATSAGHIIASGKGAHAEGYIAKNGRNIVASDNGAHAEGSSTSAVGDSSHAEGYYTNAYGANSHAEGCYTSAEGNWSHAEGGYTKASGNWSHAEGSNTKASGVRGAHAEGYFSTAAGDGSHAEGGYTTSAIKYPGGFAYGYSSHAEGVKTSALSVCSHAEGYISCAAGNYAHAEGSNTKAGSNNSHAEGDSTAAYGNNSHAEGYYTTAYGANSHAEGYYTSAKGKYAHAEGYYTTSSNFASHAGGHYNAAMTTGGSGGNQIGTAFVIGNGTETSGGDPTLSNAFSIQYDGTVHAAGAQVHSAADYAEFFEWIDGNVRDVDRVGYFVTTDKTDPTKITLAEAEDDYVLGIVSGAPCVIGNGDCDVWNGMTLKDEFGRIIYEEPGVPKYNPKYDPSQPYISRMNRKEWAAVGMLGVLPVRDDGTCQVGGFCTVGTRGTATKADKYDKNSNCYKVIERINNKVIKVIFK